MQSSMKRREKRHGHEAGVDLLDEVVAANFDAQKMAKLDGPGLEKLLERSKPARIAGGKPELLAAPGIQAVVQGDFEHLGQIEITGEEIGLAAESPGFLHATAASPLAGIFHRLSLTHQFLNNGIGVENRGLAEPGTHDFKGPADKAVGILLAELHHGGGLQETHLLDHIKDQVAEFVDRVAAVGLHPAHIDQGEIHIGVALLGRHAGLGRCGGGC